MITEYGIAELRGKTDSEVIAALKEFEKFPAGAQREILRALTVAAEGRKTDTAKPMKGLGSGVYEVAPGLAGRGLPDGLFRVDGA